MIKIDSSKRWRDEPTSEGLIGQTFDADYESVLDSS